MARARRRIPRKLYAWTLAFAAMALLVSASPAAALPGNFWGVVPQAAPTTEQFQRLKLGGVDSVRIPIAWNSVQPVAGVAPNWSNVDLLVKGGVEAGIDVFPFVYGAPSWIVPEAVVDRRQNLKAPRNLPVRTGAQRAAWTAFLQQVVVRYGPRGSFWAEHPTLPVRPIRTWQIWNEANFKYFVAQPNPAEYGKLVNVSYAALKTVDPGAKIVLGGLFAKPKEARWKRKPPTAYFATDFLDLMYASTPGVKRKFVGVGLHPYTGSYRNLTPDIEEVRDVLEENGDSGKGLWITEVTWSSGKPEPTTNDFAKGPAGQVTQLKGAFSLFSRNQVKWRLKRVYWFSVDDQVGVCNFCDGSGLFGPGFVPKQSWYAYVKFAGGRPG